MGYYPQRWLRRYKWKKWHKGSNNRHIFVYFFNHLLLYFSLSKNSPYYFCKYSSVNLFPLDNIKSSFAKKIIEQIKKEKDTNKEKIGFSQATVTPNTADSFSREMGEIGFDVKFTDEKLLAKIRGYISDKIGIKVDKINF